MKSIRRHLKPRYLIWLLALPVVWWALRSIPLEEIRLTLNRLMLWQVLALIGINLIILLLFTSRWWVVLRTLGYRLPLIPLVGYRLAGFGISYFTPGPQFGGEPLQIQFIRQNHAVPTPTAVAAVSLDKLVDLLANFSFILVGIMVVLRSRVMTNDFNLPFLALSINLFVIPAAYLLGIWAGWRPLAALVNRNPFRYIAHPIFKRAIKTLLSSEEQMVDICRQNALTMFSIMGISALTWVLVVAEYWLTLQFLGASLDGYQVISLLTAARIAFLLPSPGGLGTLEASQILMMGAFGLYPALAVSASLLIRGRDVILGSLGLWIGAHLSQRQSISTMSSQPGD